MKSQSLGLSSSTAAYSTGFAEVLDFLSVESQACLLLRSYVLGRLPGDHRHGGRDGRGGRRLGKSDRESFLL